MHKIDIPLVLIIKGTYHGNALCVNSWKQKIQTQKWCIREKFRHQKLGVMKGFFILIPFFYFSFRPLFGKMIAAPPRSKQLRKNLGLWSI